LIEKALGRGGFGSSIKCSLKGSPEKPYALKLFAMETPLTEPDPYARHTKNIGISDKAFNEFDLQVLCAKDCKYVANAHALALN